MNNSQAGNTEVTDSGRTCYYSGKACPQCGAPLNTDGTLFWCSFIGGKTEPACAFGLQEDITLKDLEALEDNNIIVEHIRFCPVCIECHNTIAGKAFGYAPDFRHPWCWMKYAFKECGFLIIGCSLGLILLAICYILFGPN